MGASYIKVRPIRVKIRYVGKFTKWFMLVSLLFLQKNRAFEALQMLFLCARSGVEVVTPDRGTEQLLY